MDNSDDSNQNKNQPPAPDAKGEYNQYIDPDYQKKQKKKKMLIIAISVSAVLITIILVAVIASSLSSPSKPSVSENGASNNGGNTGGVTAVCEGEQCFAEKFSLCQPAKYEGQGPEENSTVEYTIPGVQNVGCLVSLKYLDSEDEEIIGKEMTCDFDNESSFRESLTLVDEYPDDHECGGSLVDFYNSVEDETRSLYGI